jgi:hypothetical protein
MKFAIGLMTAALTFASSSYASQIYVRHARGHLTRSQASEVTGLVKDAVRNMSEHTLVPSAAGADFVLQPSVINRGDEMILRVEKEKNGEIISMSEETIKSINASKSRAVSITETVLADSKYSSDVTNHDATELSQSINEPRGTVSAMTSGPGESSGESPSESSSEISNNTTNIRPNDSSGAIDVSRESSSRAATTPSGRTESSATYQTTGIDSTAKSPGADASVGELTSASPRMLNPDRIGQIQLGVGTSFGINMKDDSLMYDLMAAYAADFNENFVGKVFGDFNLATGSSTTHFINLGLAGEYYPTRELLTFGKPYLAADLGYAFTRDGLGRTGDGLATGLGAGFKFQAAQMNWDVAANYSILLSQVEDETPSVFGVRVALGF